MVSNFVFEWDFCMFNVCVSESVLVSCAFSLTLFSCLFSICGTGFVLLYIIITFRCLFSNDRENKRVLI